jgi:hypothetical protein
VAAQLTPSATLSAAQRLAVYQRGYFARLLSCMAGQFKALRHALGEELFADFVEVYLSQHPSRSPTLSDLGQHFADYLEASRPDAELPTEQRESWADLMVDLARYEWQLFLKFDGPGPEDLPMAGASTPDEALRIQPSLSLHQYRFAVDSYCHAVTQGEDPPMPGQQTTRLALLRNQYRVGIFRLTPAQSHFLQGMLNGLSVSQALTATASQFNTPAQEARQYWQNWRQGWVRSGFFVTT